MPLSKPLLFERKLLPKLWGGRALGQMFGLSLPAGEGIGETWELYDRPEGSSRLRGSTRTLADVMRDEGEELLGRGVARGHGGRFPLLLKFIDARDPLSVQVHPDDEQARGEGDGGKDEAWLVLRAGPSARIVRGLRPGVEDAAFRRDAHTAAVEPMLWSFAPSVGDVVHIPPGTIHALGPEVLVFEVQQNSDLTYRLYDWGRPREVHVQKALAVARTANGAHGAVEGRPVVAPTGLPDGGELLIATPHFRLRRYRPQGPLSLPTEGRFVTLTVLGGRGMVGWRSGGEHEPLPIRTGDTVLVPASLEGVYVSPVGPLDVAVCDPGAAGSR